MKRLAFFGDKQEQGLVSLEPTAHVKNLMKYFFPFLSPKRALWVHPSFSSISGMSSLSLINTPLSFVIQLPFASKSTGCSCTCTSAPLRAYPGLGFSGLPSFSSISLLLAFPFWVAPGLAGAFLDLPALPTHRSPVLGTPGGHGSPLLMPLPHTFGDGRRADPTNRLYLGHGAHTHQGSAISRHPRGSHGAEAQLEKATGGRGQLPPSTPAPRLAARLWNLPWRWGCAVVAIGERGRADPEPNAEGAPLCRRGRRTHLRRSPSAGHHRDPTGSRRDGGAGSRPPPPSLAGPAGSPAAAAPGERGQPDSPAGGSPRGGAAAAPSRRARPPRRSRFPAGPHGRHARPVDAAG